MINFKAEALMQRIAFRTDARRVIASQYPSVQPELHRAVADIAEIRLTECYAPLFQTLNRIDTLLRALKYVVVLLLVFTFNHAEARHGSHHHYIDTSVYVPPLPVPRVEPIVVADVFSTGADSIQYPYLDPSTLYPFVMPKKAKEIYKAEEVEILPKPVKPKHDHALMAQMLIALGLVVVLVSSLIRVTGRCTNSARWLDVYNDPDDKLTLVRCRPYVPQSVTALYCQLRHHLRLR